MIAAVIVTFNRKELLDRNIEKLLLQKKRVDSIYIVDNCSTDGTYEYLKEKGRIDSEAFHYIKTETNIGGAGGFYTGVKAAYEDGADWVLLMDDDGFAADENTFEILMSFAQEAYDGNKYIFMNALVQMEDLLSFKIRDIYTVTEAINASENGIIMDEANPFNGTLISKELIAKIGYPNKDFFIKGDEVDYKQRARAAGAFIGTVVDSRYIHPRPDTSEKVILGKKVPFFVEAPWKEYYAARNFTYMYKRNGQYKAILFELILVKFLAIMSSDCPKLKTIRMMFKGIKDGFSGKLGAIVKP